MAVAGGSLDTYTVCFWRLDTGLGCWMLLGNLPGNVDAQRPWRSKQAWEICSSGKKKKDCWRREKDIRYLVSQYWCWTGDHFFLLEWLCLSCVLLEGQSVTAGSLYCSVKVFTALLHNVKQTVRLETDRDGKQGGGRQFYRFNLLAVGLPGSVPLQQLFDCGLHPDTLVHPRLICMKRTACHSCLLITRQ